MLATTTQTTIMKQTTMTKQTNLKMLQNWEKTITQTTVLHNTTWQSTMLQTTVALRKNVQTTITNDVIGNKIYRKTTALTKIKQTTIIKTVKTQMASRWWQKQQHLLVFDQQKTAISSLWFWSMLTNRDCQECVLE